jgi:hypothetical protein
MFHTCRVTTHRETYGEPIVTITEDEKRYFFVIQISFVTIRDNDEKKDGDNFIDS